MRHRIKWITFWTTLTFWLGGLAGCAGGAEQNYKVLEEDRPLFETTPNSVMERPGEYGPTGAAGQAGASVLTVRVAQSDQAPTVEPAPGAEIVPGAVPIPASDTAPMPATTQGMPGDATPSLRGLDRSHWSKIVVGPVSGQVSHYPLYFHDVEFGQESALHRVWREQPQDVEAAMVAALEGTGYEGYSRDQSVGLVVQPVKFFVDVAALLFQAVINPPWTTEYTPAPEGDAQSDWLGFLRQRHGSPDRATMNSAGPVTEGATDNPDTASQVPGTATPGQATDPAGQPGAPPINTTPVTP